jgi:membrane-associated phospholipid phosphatase
MDAIWQVEIAITLFLQGLGDWLSAPMRAFTFLGDEMFFLLVMPAFYWSVDVAIGIRLGLILLLSNAVNPFFKIMFHGARPFWFDQRVRAIISEHSFGMPSGHAQTAASVWGMLAANIKRRAFTILVVLVVFTIGLSRIYLGVHFTSDVLMGWLIGGLLLVGVLAAEKPVMKWFRTFSLPKQIGLLLASSLLLILFPLIPLAASSGYTLPAAWLETAAITSPDTLLDPLNPSGIFTVAGTWFGMTAGALWLFRQMGGYSAAGSIWKRALRFPIGVVGVLILYIGLGSIFPKNPDLISYSLRFVRYALIGGWVSIFAPLLFIRIGLASRNSAQISTNDEKTSYNSVSESY